MLGIIKGRYNPGANPFATQPSVRFDSDATLGDPGVVYEFNVKLYRVKAAASEADWEYEVGAAREEFELRLANKYPWLVVEGFTGRSGGWLAIKDTAGRMTVARLRDISDRIDAARARFKRRVERDYPRPKS